MEQTLGVFVCETNFYFRCAVHSHAMHISFTTIKDRDISFTAHPTTIEGVSWPLSTKGSEGWK